jgi:hypothetical protein
VPVMRTALPFPADNQQLPCDSRWEKCPMGTLELGFLAPKKFLKRLPVASEYGWVKYDAPN